MKLLELLFCEFVSPYDNEYYEKLQSKAIQQYGREREREDRQRPEQKYHMDTDISINK